MQSENVEYFIDGIIYSKIAEISYIKDQAQAQKQLEKYF
jgi:hypothetical protein